VGTQKRSTLMPEVAPISETVPGFEAATWVGLLAPAGTPREIVDRMQQEIAKVLRSPDVQEKLSASGAEPVGNTPEQFGAYVASEVAKWGRVVKQAKIPPVQ
ncbi:MAG TPA: tripartite tricarboxylate transporter substrate-binding protein, partial [Usitatibacter sp.]|nr:tripartite tricarboxylate transporter substrate-binding protein [Usitatibacter sp.]